MVSGCTIASQHLISGFQELSFETHGPKQNHMDMGQFRAYLQKHGLEYMFNKLFGIEGQGTERNGNNHGFVQSIRMVVIIFHLVAGYYSGRALACRH